MTDEQFVRAAYRPQVVRAVKDGVIYRLTTPDVTIAIGVTRARAFAHAAADIRRRQALARARLGMIAAKQGEKA